MINSILSKEWIKLKNYIYSVLVIVFGVLMYFSYILGFEYGNIEPESMMWYMFVHLEHKPYEMFFYLFLVFASFISIVQFVYERIRNRIKILRHLPMSYDKIIWIHLAVGLFFVTIFWILSLVFVILIFAYYYPFPLIWMVVEDFCVYLFVSWLLYLTVSFLIIEANIIKKVSKSSLLIALIIVVVRPDFSKDFTGYYIFYSPVLKEFIYQKNYGEHQFDYKSKSNQTYTQKEYESNLPFVYWKNLQIQGKLPITIDNTVFDVSDIKDARLSFEYKPEFLETEPMKLYPFFNPKSTEGMIKFPEEALFFGYKKLELYDFDNKLLSEQTVEINSLANSAGVSFPIQKVFGKPTNMKPFDLGYLFLDNENKLFHIKKEDDITTIKAVMLPKDVNVAYIHISENKLKKTAGYMIDDKSRFYIMDWDFGFRILDIQGFDYQSMKAQLLSNSMYYTFRYNDSHIYNAVVFDKEFNFIDDISLEYK